MNWFTLLKDPCVLRDSGLEGGMDRTEVSQEVIADVQGRNDAGLKKTSKWSRTMADVDVF